MPRRKQDLSSAELAAFAELAEEKFPDILDMTERARQTGMENPPSTEQIARITRLAAAVADFAAVLLHHKQMDERTGETERRLRRELAELQEAAASQP
jgi:hypothetical protein